MSKSQKPDDQRCVQNITAALAVVPKRRVVSGFDAFVDETFRIVGQRTGPQQATWMPTISDFGDWSLSMAGLSGLREIVPQETSFGGCAINLGDGLASMDFELDLFANVGRPAHPAFSSMLFRCHTVEPLAMDFGRTCVFEFNDGKLMFSVTRPFAQFTLEYFNDMLAQGVFPRACQKADGIALTSWAFYPFMTDCWQRLCKEVLSGLSHRPHLFFDLADPVSRTQEDMLSMLDVLTEFEKFGRVTLSLNGSEANQIAGVLDLAPADDSSSSLQTLAQAIRQQTHISEVGIHLVKSATGVCADQAITVDGPYCSTPKKSVGAGDRFNAGYLAGLLLDLSMRERLMLGCASSGHYVRHAVSADRQQLVQFLKNWTEESFTCLE
ncbi:MAG: hypothetical protein JKX85_10420 [Phycisphaeraceae bacterium]|nr:hypothetical protein [Phycisphaeraceae bacterium]